MQSCNTLVDYSPFETVLFIAEAYFQLHDYATSNDQLYKVLETSNGTADGANGEDGELSTDIMLKTFKMIARNFLHNQNFKEAIKYLIKAIKLIGEVEDKVELYQQVTICFINLEEY